LEIVVTSKMVAHTPVPIFDYQAIKQPYSPAESAMLLAADDRSTVAEVGNCVAAEHGLVALRLTPPLPTATPTQPAPLRGCASGANVGHSQRAFLFSV
jgi:hypothetical protein